MYCQRPSRNPEAITRADLEMEMEEEEHLFAFSRKDEDEDEEEGGKKERGACGQLLLPLKDSERNQVGFYSL